MNEHSTLPLCDACTKPGPHQRYMGYAIMLCWSCRNRWRTRTSPGKAEPMTLAQLNAEANIEARHDTQRTPHILIAIDTLTDCWNGLYDTTEFVATLRNTADRLNTLADAVENKPDTTRKLPHTHSLMVPLAQPPERH